MATLSMSSLVRMRNHVKWQALLSLIICLSISLIFTAEQTKAISYEQPPVSISAISQNYVLLSSLPRLDDTLWSAKTNRDNTFARILSKYYTATLPAKSLVPKILSLVNHIGDFDYIFISELQQACQLLDIPPPVQFNP